MKINWKLLILCIAIPLGVGAVSALLTKESMEIFENLNQPALSPPGWLFPVVWTVLYILMGISSYLILTSGEEPSKVQRAISVYGYQLAVNFLWPTFFFNFRWYFVAFLWLLFLIILVVVMIGRFYKLEKRAAYLNIPYLLWLIFAGYLNFSVYLLN